MAPFDLRWVYYEPRLLGRARYSVMRHMLRPNVGLVFMRQSTTPGEYDHFLVTKALVSDRVFHSAHGAPFLAPLYRYEESGRVANLRSEAVDRLASAWQMRFVGEERGDLQGTFGPEDVLHYLYSVVHGTAYRRTDDAQLRTDFPRLPVYENVELVRKLCELGRLLVASHTFVVPPSGGRGPAKVGTTNTVDFRLGGYEPVRRWLKQRKRRELSTSDEMHYERLNQIAGQTLRLRQEIDAALK
jgi:predicted helicase